MTECPHGNRLSMELVAVRLTGRLYIEGTWSGSTHISTQLSLQWLDECMSTCMDTDLLVKTSCKLKGNGTCHLQLGGEHKTVTPSIKSKRDSCRQWMSPHIAFHKVFIYKDKVSYNQCSLGAAFDHSINCFSTMMHKTVRCLSVKVEQEPQLFWVW